MTYVVVARWVAKAGNEDAVGAAIDKLTEPSRSEPGCLRYIPTRSIADPRVFLIFEEYTDEAAFQAHAASEHFARYGFGEGIPLLESREREFYEPLA